MLRAEVRVSAALVTLECDDVPELVSQMAFWTALPEQCPKCASPVHFFHRKPKGHNYYGLLCTGSEGGERHECNFIIYQEASRGLGYDPTRWEKAYHQDGGGYGDEEEEGGGHGGGGGVSSKGQEGLPCEECGTVLKPAQVTLSQNKFGGRVLCPAHQPKDGTEKPQAGKGEKMSGPPSKAAAPSGDRKPTAEERDTATSWVVFAKDEGIIEPGEATALLTELKDCLYSRVMAIFADMQARHEAHEKGAKPG